MALTSASETEKLVRFSGNGPSAGAYMGAERRLGREQRTGSFTSLLKGGLAPRRRYVRRVRDEGQQYLDWYTSPLFFSAIAILLLSGADGALTLNLLGQGAVEINPFMAMLIELDVRYFATVKMLTTAIALIVLVPHCELALFGVVKVARVINLILATYVTLVGYELVLLFIALATTTP